MSNTIYINTTAKPSISEFGVLIIDNINGNEFETISVEGRLKLGAYNITSDKIVCSGLIESTKDTIGNNPPEKSKIISDYISCWGIISFKSSILEVEKIITSGGGTTFTDCNVNLKEIHGGIYSVNSDLSIETVTSNSMIEINKDGPGPATVFQDVYSMGGINIGDNVRIEGTLYVIGGGSITGNSFIRNIKVQRGGLTYESTNTEQMGSVEVLGGNFTYSGKNKPNIKALGGSVVLYGDDTVIGEVEMKRNEDPYSSNVVVISEDSNVTVKKIIADKISLEDGSILKSIEPGQIGILDDESPTTGTMENVTINPSLIVIVEVKDIIIPNIPQPEVVERLVGSLGDDSNRVY